MFFSEFRWGSWGHPPVPSSNSHFVPVMPYYAVLLGVFALDRLTKPTSSTLRIGEQQASGSGLRWPAAACYAWPTGEAPTGKIKIYPAFGAKPEKAAQVVASNLRLGSSKSRTASDASCRVEVSRGARRVGRALAGRKWQPREQLSYKRLIALCGLFFFFLIHMAHGKGYARCAVA